MTSQTSATQTAQFTFIDAMQVAAENAGFSLIETDQGTDEAITLFLRQGSRVDRSITVKPVGFDQASLDVIEFDGCPVVISRSEIEHWAKTLVNEFVIMTDELASLDEDEDDS